MSNCKYRVLVDFLIDENEYVIPSDGNIRQSIKDDIKEALESSMQIKIVGMSLSKIITQQE